MEFSYGDDIKPWNSAESEDQTSIRVIELQPPPWWTRWLPRSLLFLAPLRATIKWERLGTDKDTKPAYKALSYTWGKPDFTSAIVLNGKKLGITPSLAVALQHLRLKSQTLKLWIDQISINQKNLVEKGEQVNRMDRIYRHSEEGLVWLGLAADGSDEVMDVFDRIRAFSDRFGLLGYYKKEKYQELLNIEKKAKPEDARTIEYHEFCDSIVPYFTSSFLDSLIAFYNRPWFTRAWVVQEYALPPEVTLICGNKRIKAESLMAVIQLMLTTMHTRLISPSIGDEAFIAKLRYVLEMNTLHPFFATRQQRKKWDAGDSKGETLDNALVRLCVQNSVRATHGCDLVYGLLGFTNNAKRLEITPEYSEKDPETQTVVTFTRTARKLIAAGNVDLLIYSQHLKKNMSLPSWVPDWRSDLRRSFAWLSDHSENPIFSACRKEVIKLHDSDDKNTLALEGYIVDEVEEVGGPWTDDDASSRQANMFHHESYSNILTEIRLMCLLSKAKGSPIYSSPERRDEAFWRVPVGDTDSDDTYMATRATQKTKLGYDYCLAQIELQIQYKSLTSLEDYKKKTAEIEEMGYPNGTSRGSSQNPGSMYRVRMQEMKGKRPFLTKIGYVGMGPSYMGIGDAVIVLGGATLPFIVRPLGKGKYRFIGECYCDGIMDGEAVKPDQKDIIVLV